MNDTDYIQQGLDLANRKKYEEAIEQYTKAIELVPDNADAHYGLGSTFYTLKKYEEAVEQFRKALELRPDNVEAYNGLGSSFCAQKNYEEAKKYYRKAIELSPNDAFAHNCLGIVFHMQKQYEEAIEHYAKASEISPGYADPQYNWGQALRSLEKYREAIEHYAEAIELAPDNAEAHNGWGKALHGQKKYEEAIEHYAKASEISPGYADPQYNWGSALEAMKKYEEAIEHYRKAIEQNPDDANAYNAWGNALLALKRPEEAIDHYAKASEISPGYAEAQYNWGLALEILKRYEEAIVHYRKAVELSPDNAEAHNGWGDTLIALKRSEEAIDHFARASEISPGYAEAQYNWGLALEILKRYEEAIVHYRKAVELSKEKNDSAYIGWGNALCGLKKQEEAIKQYGKAAELSPENVFAHNGRGNALVALKRYDEARDHYEKAIDINPKSALTCYACHNLTEILWIQGKYDEGRFAWERALQIYEQRAREEEQNENADFFLYYGAGIIRYARDLQTARGEAIDVFRRGLAIDQKHTGILAATITTALDWLNEPCNEGNDVSQSVNTFLATTVKTMFEWLNGPRNEGKDVSQSVVTFHKVREYFKRAESVLKERLNTVERQENIIIETKQELGNLYVIMEEYDKAETELTEVCKKNSESSAAHTYLGVLYFRKGDYGKAKQCFERARRIDRDDLNLWSNLAEVYLKINPKELTQIEKAECEFKKILKAAHDHIDSLIGLGEVFVSKAEAGDEDFYDGAIKYYNQAIELAEKSQGSKLLTNREKASLHYSLGYARVMFYEASRPLANESMLKEARKDFKKSVRENPEHYKAQMALEKLEKRLGRFSRSLFSEKLSAWLVVMLSTFVFVMAQWSVIHDIKAINGLAYSGLTFGSLIFIVVGLYLPSIQKLKGAGIELEKSTTTHISGPSSIKIAK